MKNPYTKIHEACSADHKVLGKVAILIGVLALLLVACAPKPEPTTKPEAVSTLSNIAPKEAWEGKWDSLVANAKKEGRFVIYTSVVGTTTQKLLAAFYNKYGINAESVIGRGAELAPRIIRERRSGLYILDVYVGSADVVINMIKPDGILDPLEPVLILPEVVNPALWYDWQQKGGLPWADKDKMLFTFAIYGETGMGINTNLVKPDEIKSFKDLLDTKWYRNIVMNDPSTLGAGLGLFASLHLLYGVDYWKSIVKLEPMIIRDQRLQVEWLSQGKYAIAIAPDTGVVSPFQKAGAPIMLVSSKEALIQSGSGNVALVNRAPHPNSARVFINWLLTKEAQTIYAEESSNQSAREDVPIDKVIPEKRRQAGKEYFFVNSEEFTLKKGEYRNMAAEVFKDLLPK